MFGSNFLEKRKCFLFAFYMSKMSYESALLLFDFGNGSA